ncbi:glycoside hydrolase [Nadsonia fulvescens var. elongata DSM 6958]|uniref:Glycoside hydrolase n=1 Tax=Nadsonia fulvescens var. elongata DSM 6958 TaxID=857566 RepID=A0A1E3PMT3_9ASCO|nr:glycoside hydrolase [Nadsonia fulvescens var. elongata DSM 6958]
MKCALLIDSSGQFTDNHGRAVILRGINLAADAKLPMNPYMPTHASADDTFFNGDNVSFVNSPFELEDADIHFKRIKDWGFNVIRYIFTWEALEHSGPGQYDDDFVEYTVAVLKKLKKHGIMAFMDPHQDVWSRFSGGSGSPMWTFYAAGLNPKSFKATEAAIVQSAMDDRSNFPKMIWSTNVNRLACQVMFTLFFAGRQLAPKCLLDGQNIQDYLQNHFCNAVQYLARAIARCPELADETTIIGYETLNEPSFGLVGYQDIMSLPKQQLVRIGTTPTAYQSMLLGMGFPVEVDNYYFGTMGPSKSGVKIVDPKGESAWLPVDYDDSRYSWSRDPEWKLGQCIWAQHGVWDIETRTVLKPNYFAFDTSTGEFMNENYFVNNQFMEFFIKYAAVIREVSKTTLLLLQPPVMALPPVIKNHVGIKDDTRLIYCPHYYDGLTLMNKHWNRYWNVDAVGIIREKYVTPALALRVGEKAIRNCLKSQLITFRNEGRKYIGHDVPCLISEIGIPYDMDNKSAYKSRNYSSQIRAYDANLFALEKAHVHYTLWNYTARNTHAYGDGWNGEDLSVWSLDSMHEAKELSGNSNDDAHLKDTCDNYSNISDSYNSESGRLDRVDTDSSFCGLCPPPPPAYIAGTRAPEAFIRPAPLAVCGEVLSYSFNLKRTCFRLSIKGKNFKVPIAGSHLLNPTLPTVIYLPLLHFPKGMTAVYSSSGHWELDHEGQRLLWWHSPGYQSIQITGQLTASLKSMGFTSPSSAHKKCINMQSCTIF